MPSLATAAAARATQSTSATPADSSRDLPDDADLPKKKKRRQSAPASAMALPKATARHKKRESVAGMRKGGIAEEVIVETG